MVRGVIKSVLVSIWFALLTFPILCIRVDIMQDNSVSFLPERAVYMAVAVFVLSFVWRGLMARRGNITPEEAGLAWLFALLRRPAWRNIAKALLSLFLGFLPMLASFYESDNFQNAGSFAWAALAIGVASAIINLAGRSGETMAAFRASAHYINGHAAPKTGFIILAIALCCAIPLFSDMYQITVLTQALIWVTLGLGLNIVVGQAGLLVLGYMAFYAVGAYTYAILNLDTGLGFWPLLPIGGMFAAIAGLLVGFPVLRLKGDYLAIVTLGFGEIVNQVLKNWTQLTGGSQGIQRIPRPELFSLDMTPDEGRMYVYYITLFLALLTIVAVGRLRDSRLGRAWMAMREDEIACETMGIDKTMAKLTAFALSACWAGLGGVLYAAKNLSVNPAPFTFMESATILCVVVLGGLGSIYGVVLGAFIIVILPEYLRTFSEYRMLIFGASMVLLMVFRPQGLIAPKRKLPVIHDPDLHDPAMQASGKVTG